MKNLTCFFKMKIDSYYDDISDGYDELYKEEQLKKLNSALFEINKIDFIKDVKNCLDVGCGTGISTNFFSDLGIKVIGIDPSKKLIEKNKVNSLIYGFAEDLPFENNSFDLVVSFSAIQNFNDIEKGLKEINRVGRKKFILTYLPKIDDKIHDLICNIFNVKLFIKSKDNIYLAEKR